VQGNVFFYILQQIKRPIRHGPFVIRAVKGTSAEHG